MLKNDQNHSETVSLGHLTRPEEIQVTGSLNSVRVADYRFLAYNRSPIASPLFGRVNVIKLWLKWNGLNKVLVSDWSDVIKQD